MQSDSRFISYDPNRTGSNITGMYSSRELAKTEHVVLISGIEIAQYRNAPNDYRVDENKRFVRINKTQSVVTETVVQERAIAKNEILQPISVIFDGEELSYIPDMSMQLNLMNGLHLTLADKSAMCRLWCRNSNGEWLFLQHTYEQLYKLAQAINERRESISENVYAKF